MKFLAQFFLGLVFIISFFAVLLAGTVKFQLLNYSFWQTTLDKNNVYQNLATNGKDYLNDQIVKEGGSKNDAKVLTDLVTTDNVRDFVTKNIQNTLSFANGGQSQLIVYVPIEKFPKSLLPKNLVGLSSEISLKDLLTKFNYQGYSNLPLASLSHSGETANLVFVGAAALFFASLILLILLTAQGNRLTAPGIVFVVSGALTFLTSKVLDSLKIVLNATLAGSVFSPILDEVTKIWFIVGAVTFVVGLVLFFVRKGSYNSSK